MQVSKIEQKARELDEMRRVRVINSGDVDFAKYLTNDHTEQVKRAEVWLDEMKAEASSPTKEVSHTMPWEKTKETDRKSTRLNSSHTDISRMPSSA